MPFRTLPRWIVAVGLLAALAGTAVAAGPDARLSAKSPDATGLMASARRDGLVPVIVELAAEPARRGKAAIAGDPGLRATASGAIERFLARRARGFRTSEGLALRGFKRMTFVPMVAFQASVADLRDMAADPQVRRVHRDRVVRPTLAQSVPLVNAPKVAEAGHSGVNAIVAVLDTGVESSHPFLSGKVVGEACFSTTSSYPSVSLCPGGANQETGVGTGAACSVGSYGNACDHGTHVAGIAAGAQSGGSPTQGVAGGADLLAIQVFSWFPGQSAVLSFTSDQLKALEWVYAQRNAYAGKKIAAVNMSLGGGSYAGSCPDSPLTSIIGKLRNVGILTVIASGNNGYTSSMSSPACTPGAVSVASTTKDDVRSSFSNNSRITTLYAPGSAIVSAVTGGTMASKSGTSMATPHVAGAVAVLRGAFPSASADQIQSALVSSGRLLTAPSARGGKLPRIDVSAAFQKLGGQVATDLQVSSDEAVEIERIGAALSAKTFAITVSAASGSVPWKLSGIPAWLKASAKGGNATSSGTVVTFTVRPPTRQTGDLTATLRFQQTNANATPVLIPVTLVWVPQTLALTPSDPATVANTNSLRAAPSSIDVTVRSNVGDAPFKVKVPSWLRASAKAGTATPDGVTLTLTPLPSKARKTVSDKVVFTMSGGSKHSVAFDVTMTYVDQRLAVAPETDTLVLQSGGIASPDVVQIRIATNVDTSDWRVTGVPAWLSPSATSGTTDEDGTVLSFAVSPQTSKRLLSARLSFYLAGVKKAQSMVLVRLQPPS